MTLSATSACAAAADPLLPYTVIEDRIEAPLTGNPGDPARGRTVVTNRQVGLCLLCHAGPFPEERFQGTVGPDLAGIGKRLSEAQIRLRIVDAARLNESTVMPPYYVTDRQNRVGERWRGRPVLTAEQIEDAVAFLSTLREP
jgi:L-cysteine S-thiosulfotransferase